MVEANFEVLFSKENISLQLIMFEYALLIIKKQIENPMLQHKSYGI